MPVDGSGGFYLSLLTESFAVRALLGSLAAATLAGLAVRWGVVRSSRARRVLVLAPIVTVAVAAVAVTHAGGVYLPQLWVTSAGTGPAGQLLETLGDLRAVSTDDLDVLVLSYAIVAAVLLTRRAVGVLVCRVLVHRAVAPVGHGHLVPMVHRLAGSMGVPTPRLLMLSGCPGGAFTAGTRRPVVVVDPALSESLDEREIEGLLAHELAHIRRRDTLLWMVVGIARDLTFFVPPLHLAARWLRREQEESADELASLHTRRPGALASSILKVWDSSAGRAPRMACAAVGHHRIAHHRVALAGGGETTTQPSSAALAVAVRVERLLEGSVAQLTALRCRAETILAGTLTLMAVAAALVVPSWLATGLNAYSLSFVYLAAPPTAEVESPAFATFRALAPEGEARGPRMRSLSTTIPATATSTSGACPCVESQSQIHQRVAARGVPMSPRMLWSDPQRDPWEFRNLREHSLHSRPLLTLTDSGTQVGFFLVARPS